MIDGNILKFGYGDIEVGSNALIQAIIFQQFQPQGECGKEPPKNVEYIGSEIRIENSYDDYIEFHELLLDVQSRKISKFIFKGYEFNFENYNAESVNVCLRQLHSSMYCYFLCMAA